MRSSNFPASVQFFFRGCVARHLEVLLSMRLFTACSCCIRKKEQSASSNRGECCISKWFVSSTFMPSDAELPDPVQLKLTVLKACAYRWFGLRWRRKFSVCQESVDGATKTATRGRGPDTGTAHSWSVRFLPKCLSETRLLTCLRLPLSRIFVVDFLGVPDRFSIPSRADGSTTSMNPGSTYLSFSFTCQCL